MIDTCSPDRDSFGNAECWLSLEARKERAYLFELDLLEIVPLHRAWKDYAERQGLSREEREAQRARSYGFPPEGFGRRLGHGLLATISCVWAIWIVWSSFRDLLPGGAAPWKLLVILAFAIALCLPTPKLPGSMMRSIS
jgi:hypothetical protein